MDKLKQNIKNEFTINSFDEYKFFGKYPQTRVTDSNKINSLNQITTANKYEYIEYYGMEYKKYNNNYYLVEPIKWKLLEINNNSCKLVSDLILDNHHFYLNTSSRIINGNLVNANNYEYSDIRLWLNKDFINVAFNDEEKNIIIESFVDNSASTTYSNTNKYECNNTNDKVYLLSYKDVTEKYWSICTERKAKITDYGRDKGVYNCDGFGDFWLRSPANVSGDVTYVDDFGLVDEYSCDYLNGGIRPVLTVKIK